MAFSEGDEPIAEGSNIWRQSRRISAQRVEENAFHQSISTSYGRGTGVGRGLGDAMGLGDGVGLGVIVGVAVGLAVAVAVGVAVAVAVAVAVGVGVGVPPAGAWIATIIGEPVLKNPTVALADCGG